jgi:allantoin racemase
MHIRVVTPVIPTGLTRPEDFVGILTPEDRLDYVELDHGPESVENAYDKMLATPDTVAKIIAAEAEGVDAVVLDCMEDPGLDAAREAVSIPVLGPCQTAMNLACILGHRFSMLSISQSMGVHFENQARLYGAWDKYASTRSVAIPVQELGADAARVRQALSEQARLAITEDRADTLIIGCTGMVGLAKWLQDDLHQQGFTVPVIDPLPLSVKLAKTFVEAGLCHSKQAFPTPVRLRPARPEVVSPQPLSTVRR